MDNIQFQEESFKRNNYSVDATSKGITGFLIKNGIAKDTKSANIILIIATFCIFGASIYFFMYGFGTPVSQGPIQQQVTELSPEF